MNNRNHFAAALSVVRRIDLWLERDEAEDADQTLRDARSALIALAAKLDYADAMLGMRGTNHDAAPAATARTDFATGEPGGEHGSGGTDKPVTRPVLGTGESQEPVAWVAFAADGSESSAVYSLYEQARAAADEWNWCVAPLYRQLQPALTDEERAVLESAAGDYLYHQDPGGRAQHIRQTLLGLLERTK